MSDSNEKLNIISLKYINESDSALSLEEKKMAVSKYKVYCKSWNEWKLTVSNEMKKVVAINESENERK
jgi:hypothetical protein